MGSRRRLPIVVAGFLVATAVPWASRAQSPEPETTGSSLAGRVSAALDTTVEGLSGDHEVARRWVRDTVRLRWYDGVLQGPLGTYLTGAANDVDQALLLAAILDRSGVPFRYASCSWSGPAPETTELMAPDPDETTRAITDVITDPDLDAAVLQIPDTLAGIRAEGELATSRLASVLDTLAVDMPTAPDAIQPPHDHIWVQVDSASGWRDMDTLSADGTPPCSVTTTTSSLDDTPEHVLGIGLEVEQRHDGELITATTLETEVSVATAAVSPITFSFGLPDDVFSRFTDPLGDSTSYTPALVIGKEVVTGPPITLPAPGDNALGEFLGVDEEEALVTGAWLRFTLTAPDGTETIVRSEVFDRIGIEARAAGTALEAPLSDLEVVGDEYSALDTVWQLGVMTGEIRLPEAIADLTSSVLEGTATMEPLDAMLRLYPSLLRHLGGDPSGPMLLLAGIVPTPTEDDQPATRLVLDALHVPGPAPQDRITAAVDAQAVIGAERALVTLLGLTPMPLGDVIEVAEAADAGGIAWIVLGPGDTPDVEGASGAALARIGMRLAQGAQVIVPAAAPADGSTRRLAWWVVDPATGRIRDEHESGRHAQLTEYTGKNAVAIGWAARVREFSCRIVGVVFVAVSIWFGVAGQPAAGNKLLKGAEKVMTAAEENRRRGKAARDIACLGKGSSGPGR